MTSINTALHSQMLIMLSLQNLSLKSELSEYTQQEA